LAWRDRRGTLGFGNVQYPEKHLGSVFQTDGWVKMKRPPVPLETTEVQATGRSKAKMAETMASEFSTSCLVWKDKNGALGFGNVRYPDTTSISHVRVDGTWAALKH
jgi:hypothetical protein